MAAELKTVDESTAIEKVKIESTSILDQVMSLEVVDQASYDRMVQLHEVSKAVIAEAKKIHDPICSHLHDMHRKATAARDADIGSAEKAKKESKRKAAEWQDKQERDRLLEQERLSKIAEEQAGIAREAAEAEAKRQREIEEAERLKLAEQAEEMGAAPEEVLAILDTPIYQPEPVQAFIPVVPVAAQTYQKAAGFTVRWSYSAVCNDLIALILAAAANPNAYAMYLQANQTVLNQIARNQKEAFNVPGCQLKKERV